MTHTLRTFLTFSLLVTLFSVAIFGCGETPLDPGGDEEETEPDFSTVPASYDTTGVVPDTMDNGVIVYVIEQGSGVFQVVFRDQVKVFITLRKTDGTIISSSYADSNMTATQVDVSSITMVGLQAGFLGMKENEKRKLIIPPAVGFGTVDSTSQNYQYRNDTLIYDVLLDEIMN